MMSELERIFSKYQRSPEFVGRCISETSAKRNLGNQLIHVVAAVGSPDEIEILFNAGADLNARGDCGHSPLYDAVEQDKAENVRKLLELGAKLNALNDDGATPLDLARLLELDKMTLLLENMVRKEL